ERQYVAEFWKDYGHILKWLRLAPAETLWDTKSLVKQVRRAVEHSARRRQEVDNLMESVALPDVGELSRSFGYALRSMTLHSSSMEDPEWHFKVCFDEAECLSMIQQRVVNTLVRTVEWPMSYV